MRGGLRSTVDGRRRAYRVLLSLALILATGPFAHSYLPLLVRPSGGGSPQPLRWAMDAFEVVWQVNPQAGSNIQGGRAAAQVMQASFNTWTGAPNSALAVRRGQDSSARNAGFDGVNLICFICQGDFSEEPSTLAVTITTAADAPGEDTRHGQASRFAGQLLDADILFNPGVPYHSDGPVAGRHDLQTVATHEVGHFLGLDHSGVVRAVMFPFAPDELRTLSYDDVAGVAALYPPASPAFPDGTITGAVWLNGAAVFGAHVYAESATDALAYPGFDVRKSPVGTLSQPDGSYRITGLQPDSYTVTAEPLDEPVTDQDVDGYAEAFGRQAVQTNFNTRWH